MTKIFNPEEKTKLTTLINEGITVMQEIQDLREGLSDTVKAIAEEMQLKPSILQKAIKVAYKSDLKREQENLDTLETILATVGKG